MKTVTCLDIKELPSMATLYTRALFSLRKGSNPEAPLEEIPQKIHGLSVNPEKLARFKKVCGFRASEDIPITYYYVFALRIGLYLLTDKTFPLPVMGLIHLNNTFKQYRPAKVDDSFEVECRIGRDQIQANGRQFDIITEFKTNNETCVECRSRFLSKTSRKQSRSKKIATPREPLSGETFTWELPANIGRAYAKVSGDYNPIHLFPWSAKLFGFKAPITHGMYLHSRISVALDNICDRSQKELSVEFKKPVFLPSTVNFIVQKNENALNFEVRSATGDKLHLYGSCCPLTSY